MRFIVDIYRLLIFAMFGLTIMFGTFLVLSMGDLPASLQNIGIAALVAYLVVLVISFGSLAILFSIHDRHIEVADQLSRIGDLLEKRGSADSGSVDG